MKDGDAASDAARGRENEAAPTAQEEKSDEDEGGGTAGDGGDEDDEEEEQEADAFAPTTHTLVVPSFSQYKPTTPAAVYKVESEPIILGDFTWKIVCHPKGNEQENHVSVYVEGVQTKKKAPKATSDTVVSKPTTTPSPSPTDPATATTSETSTSTSETANDWQFPTSFTIGIVHPSNPKKSVKYGLKHTFTSKVNDWGFSSFMPLNQVKEFLHKDTATFTVTLERIPLPLPSGYNSRQATGYVGIRNQGATCYLNSLLQSLYHTPSIRKAVYMLPTSKSDVPSKSIPLALQRVFYTLQYSTEAASTRELTASFGWTAADSFTQHDVQELNRVLCDTLDTKMRGTPAEGTISKLLSGRVKSYIKCIKVPFESAREETFYDLSLDVKGCKDLDTSLRRYTMPEPLTGQNQYNAGPPHGLQDAHKGLQFIQFPPVLHVHLKRFEYDPLSDSMVKVNDRFEFPLTIDLGPYLATPPKEDNVYQLHAVLVHTGGIGGGHYYSFIRPRKANQWFKMNDDQVTRATQRDALDNNFGGPVSVTQRPANAYMLIYFRQSQLSSILCKVNESTIPAHIGQMIASEKEQEEVQNRKVAEEKTFYTVKIATEEDFFPHFGHDLVHSSWGNITEFKIKLTTTLSQLNEFVTRHMGYTNFRLREFCKRKNDTIRVDDVVVNIPYKDHSSGGEKFFLENSDNGIPLPPQTRDTVLVFFKYYDIAQQKPIYMGKTYANKSDTLSTYLPLMHSLAGLPPEESLILYEEVRPSMIDPLSPISTFSGADLRTGDIIIFQRIPVNHPKWCILPTALQYFEQQLNRTTVRFRRFDDCSPNPLTHTLALSKLDTYQEVLAALCKALACDPEKLRIGKIGDEKKTLGQLLNPTYFSSTDLLFYDLYEISVSQLDTVKIIKVAYHKPNTQLQARHKIYVPKTGTVKDLADQVKAKQNLQPAVELRLLELMGYKIFKEIPLATPMSSVMEYNTYRIEEKPPEEINPPKSAMRLHVVHFSGVNIVSVEYFGIPFYMIVTKGIKVSEFKSLVAKRLELKEDEVHRWRVAIIHAGEPTYLQDDNPIKGFNATTELIGLHHPNKDAKPRRQEKVLKIGGC
ncbi:ubiquitin carboxyl-terminal hydrolase 12 [Pelomyxa schiedti]|nr:ubiquitin carboxyl-terminal hydrolase 12 [Pelomyxa schiedti]